MFTAIASNFSMGVDLKVRYWITRLRP